MALCYRHPGVPWYAKLVAVAVVAYAVSPIDLIPDFIPVLGLLDDLLLLPIGVWLAVKLIPREIFEECRERAMQPEAFKKQGIIAAIVIGLIWVLLIAVIGRGLWYWWQNR